VAVVIAKRGRGRPLGSKNKKKAAEAAAKLDGTKKGHGTGGDADTGEVNEIGQEEKQEGPSSHPISFGCAANTSLPP